MKLLLWKDYRLNRFVLVVAATLLVCPVAIAVVGVVWVDLPFRPDKVDLHRSAWIGTEIGLGLSVLSLCLLGGNSFAAERIDGSAEFLATLPPSRTMVLASKLTLASLTCVFIAVFVYSIRTAVNVTTGLTESHGYPVNWALGCAGFGVAWLSSVLVDSPTYAVGLGLLGVFFVPLSVGAFRAVGFLATSSPVANTVFGIAVGVAAIITGCVLYQLKEEP